MYTAFSAGKFTVVGLSPVEKLKRKLKSLKDQIPSDDGKTKFENC